MPRSALSASCGDGVAPAILLSYANLAAGAYDVDLGPQAGPPFALGKRVGQTFTVSVTVRGSASPLRHVTAFQVVPSGCGSHV